MSHDLFKQRIREEPGDDVHRLVYADWLDDHDQPAEADKFRFLPGTAALWADVWGRDSYGLWACYRINQMMISLRWVPLETDSHQGFWMDETPCTVLQWNNVRGLGHLQDSWDDSPVTQVSYDECVDFCDSMNIFKPQPKLQFRLPTEAEWEYACRGGTEGDQYHDDIDAIAWHSGNSQGRLHSVRRKMSNQYGLYDMIGNVWEWCHDPHTDESLQVYRGGSWLIYPRFCCCASRGSNVPSFRFSDIGFRFVTF